MSHGLGGVVGGRNLYLQDTDTTDETGDSPQARVAARRGGYTPPACCSANNVTQVVLVILGLLALTVTALVIAGFAGGLPFNAVPVIGASLATASPLALLCTAVGCTALAGVCFLGISSLRHSKHIDEQNDLFERRGGV